jgi:hypothetical protein
MDTILEKNNNKATLIRSKAYKLYWIDEMSLCEVSKIIGINKKFMPQLLLEVKHEFDNPLIHESRKYKFSL